MIDRLYLKSSLRLGVVRACSRLTRLWTDRAEDRGYYSARALDRQHWWVLSFD